MQVLGLIFGGRVPTLGPPTRCQLLPPFLVGRVSSPPEDLDLYTLLPWLRWFGARNSSQKEAISL